MIIKTSDTKSIRPFLQRLYIPPENSHKGQNGKLLIVGGSKLFHAASIWATEIASHFVDIVHYSSTEENNTIFLALKKKFRNGIVVQKENLPDYIKEDDAILVGPGMMRQENLEFKIKNLEYSEIIAIKNEGEYCYFLTKYLIENFPKKRFVFDAGALQMMEKDWLLKLSVPAIITPHQGEFKKLFGIDLENLTLEQKQKIVQEIAKKFNCVILLKAVADIISDGKKTVVITGGNSGLTKGGTGDILAGMTAALYTKNTALDSAILSSYLLKKTSDVVSNKKGYWYNINNIIEMMPNIINELV